MIKIVNKTPVSDAEAQSLHYFFDGNEWNLKWEQKLDASMVVMANSSQELEMIYQQIVAGQLSPIAYYIHKNAFTINILSAYTGIPKRHIKKHLKPEKFEQLHSETLNKYAEAFEISVEELKNIKK
jgi:hypothetical protein